MIVLVSRVPYLFTGLVTILGQANRLLTVIPLSDEILRYPMRSRVGLCPILIWSC
jgi:hypothetical protein